MTPKSKEEVGRERKNEEKNVVVVVAVGKKTREKNRDLQMGSKLWATPLQHSRP